MDEIALRARISKETLYSRFPSKADIFRAVIEAQLNAWEAGATDKNPIVVTHNLREALKWHARVQIRALRDEDFKSILRLVTSESERFPEIPQMFLQLTYHARTDSLVEDIQKYAAIDGVPCKDPETVAEFFRAVLTGLGSPLTMTGRNLTEQEEEQLVTRTVDLVMGGRMAW